MEADILPVLKHWITRKQDIYSLGFFTPYVRQAKEKRLKAPRPLTDLERAKNLAFIIRRVGQRMPTEERWLARYEAEHGAVDWSKETLGIKFALDAK
jgi:hypothetical protein